MFFVLFFQNNVTSNDNIQVAVWYLSNVSHPGKSKERKKKKPSHTLSLHSWIPLCGSGSSDSPSSGQKAHESSALCAGPHSLCRVPLLSVSLCVCGRCGWPVRKRRWARDIWPLPHVQVWTMSTKVNFVTRDAADVPLFCGCSCTFLSSECVNLYTWCENSSIIVYQENGTKTKNVTF